MGTTAVIGLGIVVWILLAILVALFVARVIRLRDRQRPDRTAHGAPEEDIVNLFGLTSGGDHSVRG